MTIEEYTDRLRELGGIIGTVEEYTVVPSAVEMLARIKNRVKNSGIGTAGNDIGSYSTKPIYAGKDKFVKSGAFQARGKLKDGGANVYNVGDRIIPTARTKSNSVRANPTRYGAYTIAKPNYKPRKGMYLPGGYKELREIQSLEVGYMNLSYSGVMMKDYQMLQAGRATLLGMVTSQSANKYIGLTRRLGEFFQPSEQEKEEYFKAVGFRLERLIRNTIVEGSVDLQGSITVTEIQ